MNESPVTGPLQHGSRLSIETLLERITDRDLALLTDLETLRLATTRHLQRLHFTLNSHRSIGAATRACVRVLTRLKGLGLVAALPRRIGGVRAGSAGTIWQLGPTGERLLAALRGDPKRHRLANPSGLFTGHTLAVTELVVQLREHAGDHPDVGTEITTEPHCWRPFTGGHGRPETLRPDLLLVITGVQYVDHVFVEVDRATEHLPALLRKCQTYARFAASGTYQAEHDVFPAVLWIVPTAERAEALSAAIRAEARLDPAMFTVATTDWAMNALLGDDGTDEPGNPPAGSTGQPPPSAAADPETSNREEESP